MVQFNAWEEGVRLKELLIDLIGAPLGTIVFQLVFAAQYTVYLSLIAFVGGGIAAGLHHFGEDRALQTGPIGRYRIHMVVPVYAFAHAVISLWARLSSFISVPDISLDSGLCRAHDFYVGLSCRSVAWRYRRGRDGPVGGQ